MFIDFITKVLNAKLNHKLTNSLIQSYEQRIFELNTQLVNCRSERDEYKNILFDRLGLIQKEQLREIEEFKPVGKSMTWPKIRHHLETRDISKSAVPIESIEEETQKMQEEIKAGRMAP